MYLITFFFKFIAIHTPASQLIKVRTKCYSLSFTRFTLLSSKDRHTRFRNDIDTAAIITRHVNFINLPKNCN